MDVLEQLQRAFTDHAKDIYSSYTEFDIEPEFSLNTDPHKQQFGDLSTNIALILSKQVKQAPHLIAKRLLEKFNHESVDKIEIAGAGFINFFLTAQALQQLLHAMVLEGEGFFALPLSAPRSSYSLEFVSANPTGPLHIGHGRGGIIGDVLGNILRFIGHQVIKEFYSNDAGTQIKKLGNSLKVRCQQLLGIDVILPEDGYQGEYLKEIAHTLIQQYGNSILERPDSFFEDYGKNVLLEQIKKTLSRYGINYDIWFSEKSLHDTNAVEQALKKLEQKGYTYVQDGALWFATTRFGDDKDRVLRKSSGELTYVASDVAYVENKLERGAERLIYILGQDHHSYVIRLKAIMQALGYDPNNLHVILYQLVTVKETGATVRLSKRAGRIVTLEDIIETVGPDVARFFYLNRKADAHLDFDLDLALKHTDENPVYYIQYAYVRTKSILEKAAENPLLFPVSSYDTEGITHDEALLVKKIAALRPLLASIAKTYQTHLLTYYVLELAHSFHSYYSKHRIIVPENRVQSRARLLLTQQLHDTLGICLKLLEITQVQSM